MELALFAIISLLVLAVIFVGISTAFRMLPRTAQRKFPSTPAGWTGGSSGYGSGYGGGDVSPGSDVGTGGDGAGGAGDGGGG
jgi:hypothetical protein